MDDPDLRRKAETLRAVAHPARLALLRALARGARCVSDLQKILGVSQPSLSQHLQALRRERIVDFCEDGNLRCYYIARPTLISALCGLILREHKVVRRPPEEIRCEGRRRRRG
ncbi:MAG: helix-turn-helix transcriptional regulator [Verrucomicrobiae bacterium]|nr:helix-turn-helix transcriptional regulator [Verrucomicrobiae bacterium]